MKLAILSGAGQLPVMIKQAHPDAHVVGFEGMPTELSDVTQLHRFERLGALFADLRDRGVTRIGNDGLFMAGCHVAHDAHIGNNVILVNSAAVAGHCVLEDNVIIGGLSGLHQFVRIGQGAIVGAVTMVTNDVIPYGLVQAPRGELDGLNLVGLKRRGVAREDITALRAAFQMLAQGEGTLKDRATRLSEETDSDYVRTIVDFVLAESDRSFLTPS